MATREALGGKLRLEALRGSFFSRNSRRKTSERSSLEALGFFSGSGLVVPLRRCTSVSFRTEGRIVRGKRSHRARNPEKFKVTKK